MDWSALNYNRTKHLEKNGLAFDYPDYYHIAKYENQNPAYKNSMALIKKGTLCEIYIMKRADLSFDERYIPHIENQLENKGYKNIKKFMTCLMLILQQLNIINISLSQSFHIILILPIQ